MFAGSLQCLPAGNLTRVGRSTEFLAHHRNCHPVACVSQLFSVQDMTSCSAAGAAKSKDWRDKARRPPLKSSSDHPLKWSDFLTSHSSRQTSRAPA
eukprot:2872654-Amphidinium_carterae.2